MRRLTHPRELAALAHPVRIGILELLSIEGPQTATDLAERLGESPANCSWHLRKLAEFDFVQETGDGRGRRRPWRVTELGLSWDADAVPTPADHRLSDEPLGDDARSGTSTDCTRPGSARPRSRRNGARRWRSASRRPG